MVVHEGDGAAEIIDLKRRGKQKSTALGWSQHAVVADDKQISGARTNQGARVDSRIRAGQKIGLGTLSRGQLFKARKIGAEYAGIKRHAHVPDVVVGGTVLMMAKELLKISISLMVIKLFEA